MLRLLPFLALLVAPSSGQIFFWGTCPAPAVYLDTIPALVTTPTWYESHRYWSWLEGERDCVNWKFTAKPTVGSYEMLTTMDGGVKMTSEIDRKNPALTRADYNYRVTKLPGTGDALAGKFNYQILALTTNHLVAWSCKQYWFFGTYRKEMLWIMTAQKKPTEAIKNAAIDAATASGLGVDRNRLRHVHQNCV